MVCVLYVLYPGFDFGEDEDEDEDQDGKGEEICSDDD
jgi:hypothetical protein